MQSVRKDLLGSGRDIIPRLFAKGDLNLHLLVLLLHSIELVERDVAR